MRRYTYDLECIWCGDDFQAGASHAKYCSDKCRGQLYDSQTPERECEHCGATFKARAKNRRHCSLGCANSVTGVRPKGAAKPGEENARNFYDGLERAITLAGSRDYANALIAAGNALGYAETETQRMDALYWKLHAQREFAGEVDDEEFAEVLALSKKLFAPGRGRSNSATVSRLLPLAACTIKHRAALPAPDNEPPDELGHEEWTEAELSDDYGRDTATA